MPLKETGVERKSAFSVRLFLKEFCVEFLHGAYNTLMKQIRVSFCNDNFLNFLLKKFFLS